MSVHFILILASFFSLQAWSSETAKGLSQGQIGAPIDVSPRCESRKDKLSSDEVAKRSGNLLFIKGKVEEVVLEVDRAIAANLASAMASWSCEPPCQKVVLPQRIIFSKPTVSEETWLPTAGERCSKEHFGKTNEVTLNFEKRYLSAAEKREKNNERRFENCRSQLQESLEGEIKDVLLSKVDVLVGKQTTRFDLLCPKPCSDHTTQKISFIDIRDSEGAVIGCDAKVSISLLCSKPRAEFSNTITGSYAISRSCVAR